MLDKPQGSPALGLELSPSSIRGAVLVQQKGRPHLQDIFSFSLNPQSSTTDNVKPLYIDDEEQYFHELIDKSLVATALPASDVLTRQLEVKLTNIQDIDSVLRFQAEPLLPFSADTALIDRIKILSHSKGTDLTMIAAEEEKLLKHLKPWHSLRIEPEVVSCTPAALAAFSRYFCKSDSKYFVIHIGETESVCLLAEGGKLLKSQTINVDLKNQENLVKTLTQTMMAMGEEKGAPALLTGQADASQLHNLPYEIQTPQQSDEFPFSTQDLQTYAVSIGLALTALPGYRDQINFRQGELAYPYPWKRVKKPLFRYLALSLIFSAVFYLFGNAVLSKQLDDERQEYSNLLKILHKPYSEFEKSYLTKTQGLKPGEETIVNPIHLSKEGIIKRLNFLQKEMQSSTEYFALIPNTPRVSDVLAWLSSAPLVKGTGKEQGLILDSFTYKMVKRPEQNKKKEKYLVRVDLEFTAPSPTYAREFHDFLLEPNDFIDPKHEIKWSTSRGRYVTSFYLKDRTVYP